MGSCQAIEQEPYRVVVHVTHGRPSRRVITARGPVARGRPRQSDRRRRRYRRAANNHLFGAA
jgi:hypothetical protein